MITAFLPCRAGSERVPHKNTKRFSGVDGGLVSIKLRQLINVRLIDNIVLSTNDEVVIEIANRLKSSKIIIDRRPEYLALSSTSTDELINYVPNVIKEGHVLWTHVTSPFIGKETYEKAILEYTKNLDEGSYDSLMTVNKIQTFLWDKRGSVNYNRNIEKWPRTQTLQELFEINSGMFITSVDNYLKLKDRIGNTPFLFETKGYMSFDIDWPEDFEIAEMIYKSVKKDQ